MAYSYYLETEARIEPEVLASRIAGFCHAAASYHEVLVGSMRVLVKSVDREDAVVTLMNYGFQPSKSIIFRPSSDVDDQANITMLKIVAFILEQYDGSAALETDDPMTILVRLGGVIFLNIEADIAAMAREVFASGVLRSFPSI